MAGTGRRSNPNASLPARTAAPSWRSISPGSGSPCMRMARPSFGKAMAPAKATARHRARCTTSPSRSRKPMPPNGHWRPSANRSVSSSIGVARQRSIPEAPALTDCCPWACCHWACCSRARRCPSRLPSGRYDPYSTAVPLLWPSPGSGHSGSGAGSP